MNILEHLLFADRNIAEATAPTAIRFWLARLYCGECAYLLRAHCAQAGECAYITVTVSRLQLSFAFSLQDAPNI